MVNIADHCCRLLVTSPCSVTKSWSSGIPTLDSDYYETRLCCLFLLRYYSHPPLSAHPSIRLPSEGESTSCPVLKHRPSHLRMGSHAHLGVPCILPRIPIPCHLSTGSSAHLKAACLRCRCPVYYHHSPLYDPFWSYLPPSLLWNIVTKWNCTNRIQGRVET